MCEYSCPWKEFFGSLSFPLSCVRVVLWNVRREIDPYPVLYVVAAVAVRRITNAGDIRGRGILTAVGTKVLAIGKPRVIS